MQLPILAVAAILGSTLILSRALLWSCGQLLIDPYRLMAANLGSALIWSMFVLIASSLNLDRQCLNELLFGALSQCCWMAMDVSGFTVRAFLDHRRRGGRIGLPIGPESANDNVAEVLSLSAAKPHPPGVDAAKF